MSHTNQEQLYEVKKVGKYWLIGKPGKTLKRHLTLTNYKEIELSDNYLIADGVIFEIDEDSCGIITLIEIEDAPAAEKQQNVFAKRFTKDADALAHKTYIDTDRELKDVNGKLEMEQTEDDFQSLDAGKTEDDCQSLKAGHTEDNYQSLETGHTDDCQTFENGNTEETSLIETICVKELDSTGQVLGRKTPHNIRTDEPQLFLNAYGKSENLHKSRYAVEKKTGNLPVFHVETQAKETSYDRNEPCTFEEEEDEREDNSGEGEEEEDIPEETHSNKSDNEIDQDDTNVEDEVETCKICMDDVTDPKVLPCGHVFCTECIDAQFAYKKVCPICGKVCGIITGDQPDGIMHVRMNERASCAGFEGCGRIEITYTFPVGKQGPNHPSPGTSYTGITRTAYLPGNKRGREICEMLKIAFDRKLVFTIGMSMTTGADGVITWNDIHHKTDPRPNTQFGYPDPTYLDRVTEELEIKGVMYSE